MATLDNALQALFQMANKKLVWENASPTSSFPNQQIVVNDIKDGDTIIIEHKFATAGTSYILSALVIGETKATTLFHIVFDTEQYVYVNFRDFVVYAGTKTMSFGSGEFRVLGQNSVGTDNTRAIPTRVFLVQNSII